MVWCVVATISCFCASVAIRNLDKSHGFETAVDGYWVNVFRTCISDTCLKFSMSNSTVCSRGNSL